VNNFIATVQKLYIKIGRILELHVLLL